MVKTFLVLLACLSLGPPPLPEPGPGPGPGVTAAPLRHPLPGELTGYRLEWEEASGHWQLTRNPADGLPEAPAVGPPGSLERLISYYAQKFGVDAKLVRAVLRYESGGDPLAVSPKGAQGLMQLMPATAALLGVRDAFDAADNLAGGVRYLKLCLTRFQGDAALAVAAYNAGPEAVAKYGGIPPYRETEDYVTRVLTAYNGSAPVLVRLRPRPKAPPAPAAPAAAPKAESGLAWRLPTPTWKINPPQAKVGAPRWKVGL